MGQKAQKRSFLATQTIEETEGNVVFCTCKIVLVDYICICRLYFRLARFCNKIELADPVVIPIWFADTYVAAAVNQEEID